MMKREVQLYYHAKTKQTFLVVNGKVGEGALILLTKQDVKNLKEACGLKLTKKLK